MAVILLNSGDGMEYLTAKEAGEKWSITARMANYHCAAGRIHGAAKKADLWLFPVDSEKPKDGQRKKTYENLNDLSTRNK